MFDRQVGQHAELMDRIGKQYSRHVVGIVTVPMVKGWVTGSSSGVAGQIDYEGNALIVVPNWMRASDLTISQTSSFVVRGSTSGQIYVFMNSKTNPGIPLNINASGQFDSTVGFTSICCSFNKFFIYVKTPIIGAVLQLAVLKGIDLSGCGSSAVSSDANLQGAYGAGENYV